MSDQASPLPNGFRQIRSTVQQGGTVEIELADAALAPPGDAQVVVRVEAAPINPSDIMPMLAGADPESGNFGGTAEQPVATFALPDASVAANAGRAGHPLPVGLEGAGTVVAAGSEAQALMGKQVAFLSLAMGSLGEYCTVAMTDCMPLPDGVGAEQGADLFCNPMTALAMVETLHQTGQTAMVHAAAASNLGRMLVRICKEDGVPLVNIVRRAEQADLLRDLGAEHVCDSSLPSFREDLFQAVARSGATVAFDPIGGGEMASEMMLAMERAAADRMPQFSPYGSQERKTVYVYGHLQDGSSVLHHDSFGMIWNVEGWAMPPVLERAGPDRSAELVQRVASGLTTTFRSEYGRTISLPQVLNRDTMIGYCKQATGGKVLVKPWG